jgi:hypothetical protein
MIDEWYDRTYRECHTELHAGMLRLIRSTFASLPKFKREPSRARHTLVIPAPEPGSTFSCSSGRKVDPGSSPG